MTAGTPPFFWPAMSVISDTADFRRFFHLTKVDVAKRLVFGTMAEEVADAAGEIMDYETSKPNFEKWSAAFAKATDGVSVGNVREMHQPKAAGRLELMDFDDDGKRITTCAKVIDNDTWKKVLDRVLTGFSIGGRYAKKWKDGDLTRYTAVPSEVSLVDNPCLPTATFTMVKADGTTEEMGFKKIADREDKSAADKAQAEEEHGSGPFADEKNKAYPINDAAHVRNAASRWGDPKNRAKYSAEDQKTIGAKIARAKKKFGIGDKDAAAKVLASQIDELNDMALFKLAAPLEASVGKWALKGLKKGLYDVAMLANVLSNLDSVARMAEYEAEAEGDGSKIPARLAAVREKLGEVLVDMTEEEVSELNPEDEGEDTMDATEKVQKAISLLAEVHGAAALGKAVTGKEHQGMIQEIHDHAVAMGAGHAGMHDKELKKDGYGLPETGDKAKSDAGDHRADQDADDAKHEKMQKSLETALARIEALEKQPAAPSGAKSAVTVALGKGDDAEAVRAAALAKAQEDADMAKLSPEQQAFKLIKLASANGKTLTTDDLMNMNFAKHA